MLFSKRDIDALRLLCWCQYMRPEDLRELLTEAELHNLLSLGFVHRHKKSGALVLSGKGLSFLRTILSGVVPELAQSYHQDAIQRRLRLAKLVLTACRGGVDPFTTSVEELVVSPKLFLSAVTRGRGANPWGSTRIAAIAHLGDLLCAMHYVCPGIGKLALTDELSAFANQTAQFQKSKRVFIFAGKSYKDLLAELEAPAAVSDSKLMSYGAAYRCLHLPVHLLSCDDTGAVQLQIMSVPDYRQRLTRAALRSYYQPPSNPAWDSFYKEMPFVVAADMDLRRLDAAIVAARQEGFKQVAIAALEGQVDTVLLPRYRKTGKTRVYVLTNDTVSELTGRPPIPYVPPNTPFLTEEGEVVDLPPL